MLNEISELASSRQLDYSAMTSEELHFIVDMYDAGKLNDFDLLTEAEYAKVSWIDKKYRLPVPGEYDKEHANPFAL